MRNLEKEAKHELKNLKKEIYFNSIKLGLEERKARTYLEH